MASGSGLEKGDGRVPGRFRIETKCPPTQRYRITHTEWSKLWRAAVLDSEVPVFHIVLGKHELILLRDVDYRGLNGADAKIGNWTDEGQKGALFTTAKWLEHQVQSRHWYVSLQGPLSSPKHTQKVLLRLVPWEDFIKLAEENKP